MRIIVFAKSFCVCVCKSQKANVLLIANKLKLLKLIIIIIIFIIVYLLLLHSTLIDVKNICQFIQHVNNVFISATLFIYFRHYNKHAVKMIKSVLLIVMLFTSCHGQCKCSVILLYKDLKIVVVQFKGRKNPYKNKYIYFAKQSHNFWKHYLLKY
jgi:hypothetical protein